MIFLKSCINIIIVLSCLLSSAFSSEEKVYIPQNRVMSVEEFKKAIDSDEFLKGEKLTTYDQPLSDLELELIEIALANQNKHYGGLFEPGREIDKFTGSTLLVGGGKTSGKCGENDGKTILLDFETEEKEIKELIKKLRSGAWTFDPYTGKQFHSEHELKVYISELQKKMMLYKKAFKEKNNDILRRYYILNIEDKISPDMIASITSKTDMSKIPDNKFEKIEFENVPCDVFLNPNIYPILERITKPGGNIIFSISYVCRRLIVPVIRSTKFSQQFMKKLKEDMYNKSQGMDEDYGSCEISVTNKDL